MRVNDRWIMGSEDKLASKSTDATMTLNAGMVPILVDFMDEAFSASFEVRWKPNKSSNGEVIPPESLFHDPKDLERKP